VPSIQLQNADARITYLGVVYHLGRPGSEIDPETLDAHRASLNPVGQALRAQIENAVVTIDLGPWQVGRMGEALLGVSNELRQYGMSEGRSMVPGFSDTLEEFWPEVADDPTVASDLVQHAVMLHRRLDSVIGEAKAEIAAAQAAAEAERQAQRGSWWQVWKR
jgi:hypothetical protein